VLTIDVASSPLAEADAPVAVVGAFAPASGERTDPPELTGAATRVAEAAGFDLAVELQAVAFDAAPGSLVRVPTRGAIGAATLLVVGLGAREDATLEHLRRAAGVAANAAERVRSMAVGLVDALEGVPVADAAEAVVEGLHLGAYRFSAFRSEPRPFELADVTLHVEDDQADDVRAGVQVGSVTASAAMLARDLVNTPPQAKRPPALAERATEEVADLPIEVRVLDEEALEAGGYGGILGVGRGSSEPPRLVELVYAPEASNRHVAIVGKGITFDTGGLSLKPSTAMETMKMDMAGAATALAVVKAAAQLKLPVRVTALLALAENMPSGTATRVSDVLTMKGGTTVEVINTDAEGRLVLGDALVHAGELDPRPDVIVDVATLTGAAVVALGDRIGVLMSDDDDLAAALLHATDQAGEPHWRLPVATEQYGDRIEGAIADLKNSGTRDAGTIWAGLFLHRFVPEGVAWAHLDIAGVAWAKEAGGYLAAGGTGVPVRSLLAWLRAS
jgi:leucyl aminopeptidase